MKYYKIILTIGLGLVFNLIYAVNPFLPLWEYIPDGEPYVFEDPDAPGKYRLYVYGSHDSEITDYCGREQVLWSAPVENINEWRYDGVIFQSIYDANGNQLNPSGIGDILFAPDIAMKKEKDGTITYYLYPNNQSSGREGMIAKSDRPDGPFKVCNWDKSDPTKTEGILRFDPAVFVDDDGRVYGYWGFQQSFGAELDPQTMCTLKPGTEIVTDLINSDASTNSDDFRFFEASSIRKIKDKYLLIYSRWTQEGEFGLPKSNYNLAYCYSDYPLGPWTYGGTIIDGRGRKKMEDGKTIVTATPSGNTHGGIFELNGHWWVVYHRQTGRDEYARQAMAAPLDIMVEEGKGGKVYIKEAEYTSEGFQIEGLDLLNIYPAGIACYYTGPNPAWNSWPKFHFSGSYIQPTYIKLNADDPQIANCPLVNNTNESVVGYKYFKFDTIQNLKSLKFVADLMPRGAEGFITLMAYAPTEEEGGINLGELEIKKEEAFNRHNKTITIKDFSQLKGKISIYLLFSCQEENFSLCDLYSIGFKE